MRARVLVLLTLLVLGATAAGAQSRDCNLRRSEFDNPFLDNAGWFQPRIAWDLEYAGASALIAIAIDKVTHRAMPRWLTAAVVTFAVGIFPHIRSIGWQGRYALNRADVAFDAVNRSTPFLWALADDSTRSRWKPAATWLAADLLLICGSVP